MNALRERQHPLNQSAECEQQIDTWNPPEVLEAIERDTPQKPINKDQFGVSECPKCKADAQEYQDYCFRCGQRLAWSK